MNINNILNSGSKILRNNNIDSHKLDSEILLSKVLKISREKLLINLDKSISLSQKNDFNALIKRRKNKEPLAYIFSKKEFWSKNYLVSYDTLIPRPETELLVEQIVRRFKRKNSYVLDIGTGTGCILLSILSELKNSKGVGVDISTKAVKIAIKNSHIHRLNTRVKFLKKDFTDIHNVKFDLIVSNPPYIKRKDLKNLSDGIKKFEPKLALDGGNDGLDVIKKVIYKSKNILKLKGMLALEIGNGQIKKVSKILKNNNFRINYLVKDYQQNVRCILSQYKD